MARHRLYLADLSSHKRALEKPDAHYLSKVLRLGAGDEFEAFDGNGRCATATVLSVGRNEAQISLGETRSIKNPVRGLTIAIPPPKGDRADWLVEKLTEIGVGRIIWLETERSLSASRKAAEVLKIERWQRLAQASARQCGRADLPEFSSLVKIAQLADLCADSPNRWVAHPTGQSFQTALLHGDSQKTRAILAIGPEGGFTCTEVKALEGQGFDSVSLGPWILRMETAAIGAAATWVAYHAASSEATDDE